MANIKIDLDHPLKDGETITFKAPCDCTAVTGMIVYYPSDDGSETKSQSFSFKDAHNNTLTGIGNLFASGALVGVIVNTSNGSAHLLNADTNAYLEGNLGGGGGETITPTSVASKYTSVSVTSYKTLSETIYGGLANVYGYLTVNCSSTVATIALNIPNFAAPSINNVAIFQPVLNGSATGTGRVMVSKGSTYGYSGGLYLEFTYTGTGYQFNSGSSTLYLQFSYPVE